MKAILVAIDAKYIQTNLAVRSLSQYVKENSSLSIEIAEYTINQSMHHILNSLYHKKGDVYLFSSYIWNIEEIKGVAADLNKIKPSAKFFLGGPEATYHSESLLEEMPFLDGIMLGEGEATLLDLLTRLHRNQEISSCPGLALPDGFTPPRMPLNLDTLPFPYTDFKPLRHRILYYESMRGCPFSCSYCLSSVERGVRFRSLSLVFQDLQRFLDATVPQVKFVDRTFNCKKAHAMAIWKFLRENDNGTTNFHFEMAGELIDQEMIDLLATLRPGLVQFEIGVQSTNEETLDEIDRHFSFEELSLQVKALQQRKNIHLHLDLIAGLPFESYLRFQQSFDDVYALSPHQLQLGFLKVLGGSKMETNAPKYGLLYQEKAPYEVLQTHWISFDELSVLHGVDNMVDHYYNSGRYQYTLEYLMKYEESPYAFYLALSQYFIDSTEGKPVSKTGYYEILGNFQESRGKKITETLQWYCKYDLLLHENLRKVPSWITVDLEPQYWQWIRRFYNTEKNIQQYLPNYTKHDGKYISRITHMEVFPFHPQTGKKGITAVLFDYNNRDILENAATTFLSLED